MDAGLRLGGAVAGRRTVCRDGVYAGECRGCDLGLDWNGAGDSSLSGRADRGECLADFRKLRKREAE